MAELPPHRDWSATDEGPDSDRFVEYLETATSFESIQAYKARSYELLDLEAGHTVLDAGCGIGDDALALAEALGPTGTAIGIDSSDQLIQQARERASGHANARFAPGDICDLDFEAGVFDASRADRVLQHLDRPAKAVSELIRVTRPGGRVGLTDPDWGSLVIDAPGPEPPHQLLDPDYAVPSHPTMGRHLYRLAREMGLIDMEVHSFMVNTTDFAFTYEMAEMERWTATMGENDLIEDRVLEKWRDRLKAADESQTFFAALPAHTVTGTVPE